MRKSFSPFTVPSEQGIEYEGAIINAANLLMMKKNKVEAIHRAFYRNNAPFLRGDYGDVVILLNNIKFPLFQAIE